MSRYVERLTEIKPEELKAVLLGFACFFSLLSGCYILRPIRDAMGLASGIQNLHWLFSATLLTNLLVSPVFSWLCGHFERQRLVVGCYSFLLLNLLCFYCAYCFLQQSTHIIIGRIFFIWLSVYNLFVVSLFWSLMADGFDSHRSRRVFAFIAAGGSTGALCGSAITQFFVDKVMVANLFLVSVAVLAMTIFIVTLINKEFSQKQLKRIKAEQEKKASSFSEGIRTTLTSPFLRAISFYVFLYTLSSTFIYFLKVNIVNNTGDSTKDFVILFSQIDLYTNALTFVLQFSITAKLVKKLGITIALLSLPLTTLIGFLALAVFPFMLTIIIVFESLRRTVHHAMSKPSLESLYSSLNRNETFQAKNFIDTFVYRMGDTVSAWLFGGIRVVVAGVAAMSWIAVPMALIWCCAAIYLGKKSGDK